MLIRRHQRPSKTSTESGLSLQLLLFSSPENPDLVISLRAVGSMFSLFVRRRPLPGY